MTISLWDTTGNAVVKALSAERRSAGGVTSGMALTLVVIVDEQRVREAEAAATIAAAAHPCRLLIVVRGDVHYQKSRLDAEIVVGGRLGPCEAAVMRMNGRLALHAESVVMPLLAPDVPVVTWWHTNPPERIAYDPLGVVADRRITDCVQSANPLEELRTRAEDYAPGDTDLAWTRITAWRTLLAGTLDAPDAQVAGAVISAPPRNPTAALLGGWLSARLGARIEHVEDPTTDVVNRVQLRLTNGETLDIVRHDATATLSRAGFPDRILPLVRRPLGEELAEELRRLDPDQPYAQALAAATGSTGLESRPATRVHVWHDPTLAERPDEANAAGADEGARGGGATAALGEATVVEATR